MIIRQICVETELFTSGMHLNPERKACTYLRPINIFKQCKRFALTHCLWLKAQPLSNRICSFKRSRESKPTPSLNFSQRYLEDPELIKLKSLHHIQILCKQESFYLQFVILDENYDLPKFPWKFHTSKWSVVLVKNWTAEQAYSQVFHIRVLEDSILQASP